MLFNILAFISVIITIAILKRMVNIFPSLVACLLRWKENVNLESSIKHSGDRDILALSMVIPFCLTVVKFHLYAPAFVENMNENFRILTVSGIFTAFFLLRGMISMMVRSRNEQKKTLASAGKSAYTFFIILTLVLAAIGGSLTFFHVETEVIKTAMLWVSASIYALYLLRKFQIFLSAFPILTCFLYLCALEILPTGVLIASALVL